MPINHCRVCGRKFFSEPLLRYQNMPKAAQHLPDFSSLKTERTARKTNRTRGQAKADVFDYIERFYNAKRRHSTIGYLSPMEFETKAGLA